MNEYNMVLDKRYKEYRQEMESKIRPNIMILGKTGSGKSSLVNRVFPAAKAKVSDVRRGTTDFDTYTDGKINLIDSKGYEMNSSYEEGDYESANYHSFVTNVSQFLQERAKSPEKRVHIVWYCISILGERIEDYDLDMLRELCHTKDVRGHVAIVLTKCDEDDDIGSASNNFKRVISADGAISHLPVFETSSKEGDEYLDGELKKLISWSANALNEIDVTGDLKDGFVAAQMEDLDSKWDTSVKLIKRYAIVAAGIGAAPIPISDAVVLTAEQTAMCAHIMSTYNLGAIASISTSLVGYVFWSNFGKNITGNLLKIIPVVGSAIGGAINAALASTLTAALGLGVAIICKTTCEKILKGQKVNFDDLFTIDSILQAVNTAKPDAKTLMEGAK